MKIMLVGAANSIHLQRWSRAMSERGHQVCVVTQHATQSGFEGLDPPIVLPWSGQAGYVLNAWALRRLVRRYQPGIVNVHYASGYGTTAALANLRPTLLSVWGSDVYDFPLQSAAKHALLRWNLRRATRVASTSDVMARQTRQCAPHLGSIFITPFGVDCEVFRPQAQARDSRYLTIGTVKTLAPKYGIDLLIRAFALLRSRRAQVPGEPALRLLLVGGGPDRQALAELAQQLNVADAVTFVGQVPHADVPSWLQRLDVYVAASRQESFGVAAVEAGACGVPVVVTDVGGLPEVVHHGVTGLVVPPEDPQALSEALEALVADETRRADLGRAARAHVLKHYAWPHCVDLMLAAYEETLAMAPP